MRRWVVGLCLCLAVAAGWAQDSQAGKANELWSAGKRLEALPLYEQLAKEHPTEGFYFQRLADCLGAKSAQLSDPEEVKATRVQMRDAAKRAIELGDTSNFSQIMANTDPNAPIFAGIASSGADLLKQAEKAFTAGDFTTAMARYEAAAEADPHLYEAPLFAGDTAFNQGDLKTASKWFARAVAVDPDRETAYRYWGDALMRFGNDPVAAKSKFIDAVVAEPYNKLAWQGIEQWAQREKAVLLAPKIGRSGRRHQESEQHHHQHRSGGNR